MNEADRHLPCRLNSKRGCWRRRRNTEDKGQKTGQPYRLRCRCHIHIRYGSMHFRAVSPSDSETQCTAESSLEND